MLFVDHARGLGGAENSLLRVATGLDRARWMPVVACPDGELSAKIGDAGIRHLRMDLPRLRGSVRALVNARSGASRLALAAESVGADLLYANTARAAPYAAIASRRLGIPWIWHVRDFSLRENPLELPVQDRILRSVLARSASRLVACSNAVAESLPAGRVTTIHNALDFDRFDPLPDREASRRALNLDPTDQVVCFVGRLRPWKGALRFVRMAGMLSESSPLSRFVVAGGTPLNEDGEFANQVTTAAASIPGRVLLTGHLQDVRPVLAASDVFVHPGDPEPFGLTMLEAMAAGLPVVGFRHGALPELVGENEAGILVEPGDITALTEAVRRVLSDPDLKQGLGDAGRRRAEILFSAHRENTDIASLLDSFQL